MNSAQDVYHQDTIRELRRMLDASDLQEAERLEAQGDLDAIRAMLTKLEQDVVEIAAFGQVNSGKSSLLNALAGEVVFAVSAGAGETKKEAKIQWKELHDNRLHLVDTPGINEVDGAARTAIAEKVAHQSDIVMFVVAADINDIEQKAIADLHHLHKPIVLVLNKVDTLRPREIEETLESIKTKVLGIPRPGSLERDSIVGEQNIVLAAGRPGPIRVKRADGTIVTENDPPPMVAALEERLLQILEQEGKAIVAINANLFAADVSERLADLKVKIRKNEANRLINYFMGAKGLAVAVNPVPGLDVLGGMAADVAMIYQLGKIYNQPITTQNAEKLMKEIIWAWGATAGIEWTLHIVAIILKTGTFGIATVATAVPQGLAAAWSTYVIGQASQVYFRDGGWGDKGPKATIQEILRSVDRQNVMAPVCHQIMERLRGSKHIVAQTAGT
jgi:small GTP-binding protein